MLRTILALSSLLVLSSALFNGTEVTQGQYPYLVYIMVDPGTPGTYACGGGLISSRYVMSAGHCSFGTVFQVIVGTINVRGYRRANLYNITNVIRPSNFGKDGLFDYNDVAIYTIEQPIAEVENFTQYMDIALNPPPIGEPIHVSGYGELANGVQTSQAHWGITYRSSDAICNATFRDYRTEVSYCTDDAELYSCSGDSGSPLVVKPQGSTRWVSVGIDSYAMDGVCGVRVPQSVVGDVASMTDFIKANTLLAPPNFVTVQYTDPLSQTQAPTTVAPTTTTASPKSDHIQEVPSPTTINAAGVLGGTVSLVAGVVAVMAVAVV